MTDRQEADAVLCKRLSKQSRHKEATIDNLAEQYLSMMVEGIFKG